MTMSMRVHTRGVAPQSCNCTAAKEALHKASALSTFYAALGHTKQ